MADTLETGNKVVPKDLAITSQPDSIDKDKFKVVISNLQISEAYAFQFQYVFEDGSTSEWSPGYSLLTSAESVPGAPSVTVPSTSVGSIPVTLSAYPENAKRVDIYIIGGEFGAGKVADYFLAAGTKSIAVAGGTYQVSLITVTPSGVNGDPTNTFTITVSTAGETIQSPTNPNGFSINRILGGIEVVWAGTYANGTFTGFEAIKIYVGNSATATSGTYKDAGVMTGNNVINSITVPVDGTYLRYDQPVYIHARAINKNGDLGTLQVNVANNSLGARSAVSTDLANDIITNAKLVADAVTSVKIATGAITETKIATDAVTSPKIVAGAITTAKLDALAITAEKIAADAITATKIKAGEIDVTKLAAGTISVNNLEAGTITSTSYIRAGSKNVGAGTGARVEISSALIEDGVVDIQPGFYIYDSAGTAILSAPLTGGLSVKGDITGSSGTFSGALSIGSNFSVTSTGILTAASGTIGGWTINTTQLRSDYVVTSGTINSGVGNYMTLNPATPRITLTKGATLTNGVPSGGSSINIDPISGIVGPNVTVQGASRASFSLDPAGNVSLAGSVFADSGKIGGWTISSSSITAGTLTLNSTGKITITSGTISTTIDNDATISLVDTGADFSGGGALYIEGRLFDGTAYRTAYTTVSSAAIGLTNYDSTGAISMSIGNLFLQAGAGDGVRIQADGGLGRSSYPISLEGAISVTTGFTGRVWGTSGSSLAFGSYRNISAGTGAKTSSDTDGLQGDIWIQYT